MARSSDGSRRPHVSPPPVAVPVTVSPQAIPAWGPEGDARVVIETPKGSRNKMAYRPDWQTFEVKRVLPSGMSFPYDFGFIPGTRGGDGDPLDVLVLLDTPVPMGAVVACRLIGVLEGEQRSDDGWVRNDRLIGVASCGTTQEHLTRLGQLDRHLLDELEAFFVQYHHLEGREYRPLHRRGPRAARRILEHSLAQPALVAL
jgi:inorganic pyrophosphatase